MLAHKRIATICVAMANEIYEEMAPDNKFYSSFSGIEGRKRFLDLCAPTLIHEARGVLAQCLADPAISDHDKQEIFEVLNLDFAIPDAKNRATVTLPGLPH